ncbi:hypothetical protein [Gordonia aichiensis]|uniref:Uncharacterized protein n=1 Tax=Gordonia aichiensis NBRC 108223 TaxID=1220583 RepID=L7KHE2_9ACTN|nr:hypothetical protein [Gordonia aichiensis]GAC47911.1 hypothetical protein GOACH_04_03080 [Gordonia aichiensis NBRC 108223]
MTQAPAHGERAEVAESASRDFHWLSANPGKRRTEIIYLIWFLVTVPIQGAIVMTLSYDSYNDVALIAQSLVMGLGTLLLPLIFRAPQDRGVPLTELYGFRMGVFLVIWAVLGGFVGTDPWYEVLHGHFAFNTAVNPNGVPLFMLFMTISVFGFYSVILGTLYRVITQLLDRTSGYLARDSILRHGLVCLVLAPLMPLVETFAYTSAVPHNYCFDNGIGMWGLNVLVYGAWHFSSLIFYTKFDTQPGLRTPLSIVMLSGFATIGILICIMAVTKTFIAPHFVEVNHGVRMLNDWGPDNCLGPKPS